MAKNYKNENSNYMSIKETANYLNVSRRFVYNAVDRGSLKHSKLSSKLIRIKKGDADKFMQSLEMGGVENN